MKRKNSYPKINRKVPEKFNYEKGYHQLRDRLVRLYHESTVREGRYRAVKSPSQLVEEGIERSFSTVMDEIMLIERDSAYKIGDRQS